MCACVCVRVLVCVRARDPQWFFVYVFKGDVRGCGLSRLVSFAEAVRPHDVALSQDLAGWTALHHAADKSSADMTSQLLAAGASPHAATAAGLTPCHLAVRRRCLQQVYSNQPMQQQQQQQQQPDPVELLLKAGADPRARDAQGCTPLHFAALSGDVALFERLLAAATVAEGDGQGSAGHQVQQQQQRRGLPAALRLRDARGYSLLHYAVEGANMAIISRLLAAGLAEAPTAAALSAAALVPVAVAAQGLPSAVLAASDGASSAAAATASPASGAHTPSTPDIAESPPASSSGPDSAAAGGQAPPPPPMSALHLACKLCQPEAVELLLAAGYGACERAATGGQAPLHFAAMGPAPPAITDLPSPRSPAPSPAPGAPPTAADEGVESPHTPSPLTPHARGSGQASGTLASPEGAASAGQSAPSAPGRSDAATSTELVAPPAARPQSAPPQPQALQSRAARLRPPGLLHACQVRVAEALLAAGADPRVHDAYGRSPLSYGAGAGNPALVARLLAAGCDPLQPDCKVGGTCTGVMCDWRGAVECRRPGVGRLGDARAAQVCTAQAFHSCCNAGTDPAALGCCWRLRRGRSSSIGGARACIPLHTQHFGRCLWLWQPG